MPPDQALLSTLIGSNYPCLELIFMVPKVFEPLKFDCTLQMPRWGLVSHTSLYSLYRKFDDTKIKFNIWSVSLSSADERSLGFLLELQILSTFEERSF